MSDNDKCVTDIENDIDTKSLLISNKQQNMTNLISCKYAMTLTKFDILCKKRRKVFAHVFFFKMLLTIFSCFFPSFFCAKR